MDFIHWSRFYSERKNKQPLNEIVADYNKWLFGYEQFQAALAKGEDEDEEES